MNFLSDTNIIETEIAEVKPPIIYMITKFKNLELHYRQNDEIQSVTAILIRFLLEFIPYLHNPLLVEEYELWI